MPPCIAAGRCCRIAAGRASGGTKLVVQIPARPDLPLIMPSSSVSSSSSSSSLLMRLRRERRFPSKASPSPSLKSSLLASMSSIELRRVGQWRGMRDDFAVGTLEGANA